MNTPTHTIIIIYLDFFVVKDNHVKFVHKIIIIRKRIGCSGLPNQQARTAIVLFTSLPALYLFSMSHSLFHLIS